MFFSDPKHLSKAQWHENPEDTGESRSRKRESRGISSSRREGSRYEQQAAQTYHAPPPPFAPVPHHPGLVPIYLPVDSSGLVNAQVRMCSGYTISHVFSCS